MPSPEIVFVPAQASPPLAALFSELMGRMGPKAAFSQTLELVYTDGKGDGGWAPDEVQDGDAVIGKLVEAHERSQSRNLYAKFLIDLTAHGVSDAGSLTKLRGRGETLMKFGRKNSASVLKQKLFKTLLHEYVHALQFWRAGAIQSANDSESRASREYSELAVVYDAAFKRHHSSETYRILAHNSHPWEAEAERLANDVMMRAGSEVAAGKWDSVLPLRMIGAYRP
jgi:hypothetical protein